MPSFNISFAADAQGEGSSSAYRLLELPPDLVKSFEDGSLQPGSLTIKGRGDDDAVFCTPESTYAIRSIAVSNTLAIMTSGSAEDDMNAADASPTTHPTLVIQDQLHEILELIPTIPRLERLEALLRGSELDLDEGEAALQANTNVRPV